MYSIIDTDNANLIINKLILTNYYYGLTSLKNITTTGNLY